MQMRKHLDIYLTLILTLTLTVALLWPMDQLKPSLNVNDKFFHFVGFAALSFPLARTGRIGNWLQLVLPPPPQALKLSHYIVYS